MVRLLTIVCVLFAALPGTPVRAGPYDDLEGRRYAEVRRVLISRGINPVRMERDASPYSRTSRMWEAYPEVLSCAGTGVGRAPSRSATRAAASPSSS